MKPHSVSNPWLNYQDQFWKDYDRRFSAEIRKQIKTVSHAGRKKRLVELLKQHKSAMCGIS